MKEIIRYLFAIMALSLTWAECLSQQTKLLTAEKHNEYGLVYSLPITAFKVEVTAVKETYVAGPFWEYAKKFYGEEDVVKEDKVAWRIENVTLTPYGVPDPERRYLMQLKAGATTYIGVADDGMLLSINASPREEEEKSGRRRRGEEPSVKPASGKEYLEFVNEDFTAAISPYKKAQLLAEELMEIREAKISLTRGTAETMPTDGRQLEIMLESLEKQETALKQAFTGSVWQEKETRTFTFTPSEEGKTRLFGFSKEAGFSQDDKSQNAVIATVTVLEEPEMPVDSKGEEKKLPKDAVIYCIPGTATVSLALKGDNLFSQNFEMAQFGITFGLNPSIFTDKKEPSFAIFDPATGALKELGTVK